MSGSVDAGRTNAYRSRGWRRYGLVEFVGDRWPVLWFLAYQHMSLVIQTLVLATVIALVIGVLVYRSPVGVAVGNTATAVGLAVPSYASETAS